MSDKIFVVILTVILLVIKIISVFNNHIDDTDEVYGYYEPLHYLLYSNGMQTWEYSPMYAIRSYAYIYPMYLIIKSIQYIDDNVFNLIGDSKVILFYIVRLLLSLLYTYSEVRFIKSIHNKFKNRSITLYTVCFIVTSPGIWYSSTSFLPSATSTILVLLSVSSWLNGYNAYTILYGCIAVFWLGWPFIGIVFVPYGLHMLYRDSRKVRLILSGIVILLVTFVLSYLVDSYYYNSYSVYPNFNIVYYNSFNQGDKLYGVESAAYYVKNLFLNLQYAWLLLLLYPLVLIVSYLGRSRHNNINSEGKVEYYSSDIMVIYVSVMLWLIIMFTRPHKEERFLYPIYPLICFIAAHSMSMAIPIDISSATTSTAMGYVVKVIRILIICMILFTSFFLMCSRIISSNDNYSGYNALYGKISKYLIDNHVESSNICVGGQEWFRFPSHFHLPYNNTIQHVKDGFRGQLPRHYATTNGTFTLPLHPFNDKNKEETTTYVPIEECDYAIMHTSPTYYIYRPFSFYIEGCKTKKTCSQLFYEQVINRDESKVKITTTYYLPYLSYEHNKYWEYSFFQFHNGTATSSSSSTNARVSSGRSSSSSDSDSDLSDSSSSGSSSNTNAIENEEL